MEGTMWMTSWDRVLRRGVGRWSVGAAVVLMSVAAAGQSLARPGWAGSGLSTQAWWLHAVVYEVDPRGFEDGNGDGTGDLKGIVKRLDYLQSLGVDAISLAGLQPGTGEPVARLEAVDPAVGTMDDMDELLREASRNGIRVVVEVDAKVATDAAAQAAVARFWLGRGAAGIGLVSGTTEQVAALRRVTKGFVGQRILIGDAAGADMVLDAGLAQVGKFDAASLRAAMQHVQGDAALVASDGVGVARSAVRLGDDAGVAKVLATALLATRANPRLYFGQEIGMGGKTIPATGVMPWGVPVDPAAKAPLHPLPPRFDVVTEDADTGSVLSWYRRLIELHHGNSTLRSGTNDFLNHDGENALVWVSRKGQVTPLEPAVVVICNLSDKPLSLSLVEDMKSLHLRGSFLRTVIRSDNGMGGMNLGSIQLGPYGIYIGQLKF